MPPPPPLQAKRSHPGTHDVLRGPAALGRFVEGFSYESYGMAVTPNVALMRELGVSAAIVESALTCVATGSGLALEHYDRLAGSATAKRA